VWQLRELKIGASQRYGNLCFSGMEGSLTAHVGHHPALFCRKRLTTDATVVGRFLTVTSRIFACGVALIFCISSFALGQQHPQTPGGEFRAMGGWQYLDFKMNSQPGVARTGWVKTGRDSACFFPPLNTVQDLSVGAAELSVPPNELEQQTSK
jgi:hypothetical protein